MPSPNKTHGPIVKSGPTAGNVRVQNNDGKWRAKRNDTGKKGNSINIFLIEEEPKNV
jgi:membrane protein implicated in regulation of membrane protease activity